MAKPLEGQSDTPIQQQMYLATRRSANASASRRPRGVGTLLLVGDLAVHCGAVPHHRGRRPLALEHAGAGARLLAHHSAHLWGTQTLKIEVR